MIGDIKQNKFKIYLFLYFQFSIYEFRYSKQQVISVKLKSLLILYDFLAFRDTFREKLVQKGFKNGKVLGIFWEFLVELKIKVHTYLSFCSVVDIEGS